MTITKRDLEQHERNMKSYIDLAVKPVANDVASMKLTLYGKEGRNGVVGDVTDLKASRRVIKWVIGLFGSGGLFAGVASWFKG